MKNATTRAFFVLSLASPAAMAQMVNFADVQKQGGVKLTAAQLRPVAENARAFYRAENRWQLQWKNEPGGKLQASANPPSGSGPETRGVYGRGTWRIEDDGKYCLEVSHPRTPQSWCRFVYKAGTKFYTTTETDGKAYEIKFKLDKSKKK